MNKLRLVSLFLVMLTLLSIIGCAATPSDSEWHLQNYVMDYEFIGGVTKEIPFAYISVTYPFMYIRTMETGVCFNKDGTFDLVTWDGEKISGTYTIAESTGSSSSFTMNFDNGEIAHGQTSKIMGVYFLSFTFRDVLYNFDSVTELANYGVNNVIYEIRTSDNLPIERCNVTKSEQGFVLNFEDGDPITLSAESAVYAARITAKNEFIELDEILEGECLAQYVSELNYAVIYYVEPME